MWIEWLEFNGCVSMKEIWQNTHVINVRAKGHVFVPISDRGGTNIGRLKIL